MTESQENWTKILFNIEVDEDDWPPFSVETVWALRTDDGHYEIRNVPFFAYEIAWGDVVAAHEEHGMLTFDRVVRESGHSTLRVIVNDEADAMPVRDVLDGVGCTTEGSHLPKLFSVDVPPEADIKAILTYLRQGKAEDRLDLEISCFDDEHRRAVDGS